MLNIEASTKVLLLKKNMSIQKLAALSEISEPTVHSIFKKNDAKISQLEKICQVLNVPITYFFEEAGKMNQTADRGSTNFNNSSGNINNGGIELDRCLERVKHLEERIKDKDEMIELLKKK